MLPVRLLRSRRAPAADPRLIRLPAPDRVRGRALVSYLRSAGWGESDPRLRGHSNQWESREITRRLAGLGFQVDVVDFSDRDFQPDGSYDLVLAIDAEMVRLAEASGAQLRLLHLTGSYAPFQNAAELRRIEELRKRRGVECVPRRMVADADADIAALGRADACSLIGNDWTLSTFPEEHRPKITPVPVSGSLPIRVKSARQIARSGRGFLWFFGSGAVHKGLDRALEAFAEMPDLTLHVVGNIDSEQDFVEAYRRELTGLANIRWHGFLEPSSRRFAAVARQCSFVIAPSCSEGTSPATATMLQVGLYPIVSRETGVDLPASGRARYLEGCEPDDIAAAARDALRIGQGELVREIESVQRLARDLYSRASFSRAMSGYLKSAVGD